jgi:hypothetical protein
MMVTWARRIDFLARSIADQDMSFVLKILAGAAVGAVAGWLMSRSPVCASGQCQARSNRWLSLAAGIVFGAAAGYWWATKTG